MVMSRRNENIGLGNRIRKVRLELLGGDSMNEIAKRLEIHPQTWENYEKGVTIPALVILRFLALTRVNPDWLLTGEGSLYSDLSNLQENQGTG
jgi:transcriptional regulator with XRE-family HTH domain